MIIPLPGQTMVGEMTTGQVSGVAATTVKHPPLHRPQWILRNRPQMHVSPRRMPITAVRRVKAQPKKYVNS